MARRRPTQAGRPRSAVGVTTLAAVGVAVAALSAAAAPLLVYALTLAVFGAVHVLVELRYVDQRFGARTGRSLAAAFALLLGGVVCLRVLALAGVVAWPERGWLELGLVAALALTVLPRLRGGAFALGFALTVLLLVGAWQAPLSTLVLLAVLHNLTPVGFLAERLEGRARRRAMLACGVVFVLVPLVVASGVPRLWLASLGLAHADWTVLPTGKLADHLGVFVLPGLRDGPRVVDLFAAATYLQAMHYAVVIGILPRLGSGREDAGRARLPWPSPSVFVVVLAGTAMISLLAFAYAFRDARAVYGIVSALHAWVEVPVLLLALAPARD